MRGEPGTSFWEQVPPNKGSPLFLREPEDLGELEEAAARAVCPSMATLRLAGLCGCRRGQVSLEACCWLLVKSKALVCFIFFLLSALFVSSQMQNNKQSI